MDLVKIHAMDHTVGGYKLVYLCRFATTKYIAHLPEGALCISWRKGVEGLKE